MLRFFGQPRNSAFPGGQTTLNGYITSHVPYPKENICTFILFSFEKRTTYKYYSIQFRESTYVCATERGQILGENSAIAH